MSEILNAANATIQPRYEKGVVLLITLVVLLLVTTMGLSSLQSARLEAIVSNNLKQQISGFNRAESEANVAELTFTAVFDRCLETLTTCREKFLSDILTGLNQNFDSYQTGSQPVRIELFRTAGIKSDVLYLGQREYPGYVLNLLHFFRFISYSTTTNGTEDYRIETILRLCSGIHGGPCLDPGFKPGRMAWRDLEGLP